MTIKAESFQFEDYAYGMRKSGFGHALLNPASDIDAYPGVCGFIDDRGDWQRIVDVTKPQELKAFGLSPFVGRTWEKRRESSKWGPRITETVSRVAISTSAATQANIPATFSSAYRYELKGEFGAVLLCNDPVEKRSFGVKDPFSTWANKNAKDLLRRFPDIKKNGGFYVITSTIAARDIRITTWTTKGTSVVIGASAEIDNVAKIDASTEFYVGETATEWHKPQAEYFQEGEKKVLFFGGVYIKYSRLWPLREKDQKKWSGYRGSDDGKVMIEEENYAWDVEACQI
ncbi:hypothetical protein QC761_403405 [Podospora bellae-mahoneyi]|uniref:Uncharacterized protein n=1 Tax=Podospora bellae-mahoneyi TaxID=2093777 RepID=A0ABR0FJK6_9PEZI|nr:hypothetical protein QC761_403405 [Podospora bellae-mahoneyi]